jgi:L,D-transpeptidase YbiS
VVLFWGLLAGAAASTFVLEPPLELVAPGATQRTRVLQQRLAAVRPTGPYLAIDVRGNRFALRAAGGPVLRQGRCSTGSARSLRAADGRTWVFHTPRGERRVRSRAENPVWRKPDWAYVETGESIPAPDAPQRLELGVLGAYALGLGEGYYVHGTPYTLGIGRSVTHGCVRLLDDDLRAVFETLREGDPVFLF